MPVRRSDAACETTNYALFVKVLANLANFESTALVAFGKCHGMVRTY